ncbi:PadR family transcriptional regulator [Phytohabitans sp. ZYX-F-186]|uniref:PadR family transcriptional regulator n=1 Tax=Phytohabitans maris TaxID=3071409 RepID=A0ABU0ZVT1_9ACTN|nr:PadR family transcriptional regulator [Phytohabitans sp. ZYX-F-186]MDQ7911144.1 PadR family transcriptional regulator [Phytohabitans sp. ZYX-F-186]
MPYAHALLALLAERDCYAWSLRGGVEAALGNDWSGASRSHVYAIIKQLLRNGLISAAPHPSADHRPDITTHSITEAGRAELSRWMDEPTIRAAGYRDDFQLKVMAAALRGEAEIRRICDIQRRARLDELQVLHALREEESVNGGLGTWTVEVAINYLDADLLAVDSAESRAEQIAEEIPKLLAPFLSGGGSSPGTATHTAVGR